jgi:hypothetical protein
MRWDELENTLLTLIVSTAIISGVYIVYYAASSPERLYYKTLTTTQACRLAAIKDAENISIDNVCGKVPTYKEIVYPRDSSND